MLVDIPNVRVVQLPESFQNIRSVSVISTFKLFDAFLDVSSNFASLIPNNSRSIVLSSSETSTTVSDSKGHISYSHYT